MKIQNHKRKIVKQICLKRYHTRVWVRLEGDVRPRLKKKAEPPIQYGGYITVGDNDIEEADESIWEVVMKKWEQAILR